MSNFYFNDKSNNEVYCIEAENYSEAFDIANEVMVEPEFWYADSIVESEV